MSVKSTIRLSITLIGLAVGIVIASNTYRMILKPNTAFSSPRVFLYIRSTDTYKDVRKKLEPLLQETIPFDRLARIKNYPKHVKAGRYAIYRDMDNNEIINTIRGRNLPVVLTFNNQETVEKLAGYVSRQIEADSLSLLKAIKDTTFLKAHHLDVATALCMYLPNSYEVFWNTSSEDFRRRMLEEYNRFWDVARLAKAKAAGLTKEQVITLASIVYEESKRTEEQPIIAGVFINRLKQGMPLQSDPTLKFAAYHCPRYKNTIIKRILYAYRDIDSPYNTYKNLGLPPGPIAMPSISAIEAVLNYKRHRYLYFTGDTKHPGTLKFSETLARHTVNARAYHQYLSSQGIER